MLIVWFFVYKKLAQFAVRVLCLPGDRSHPVAQPTINPLACCICWARLLGHAVFPPWNKGPNSGSYTSNSQTVCISGVVEDSSWQIEDTVLTSLARWPLLENWKVFKPDSRPPEAGAAWLGPWGGFHRGYSWNSRVSHCRTGPVGSLSISWGLS